MPLARLSDAEPTDGRVPRGARSKWVTLEELKQEVAQRSQSTSRKQRLLSPTSRTLSGHVCRGYEGRRSRIERLIPLGLLPQTLVKCTEIPSPLTFNLSRLERTFLSFGVGWYIRGHGWPGRRIAEPVWIE
jgi:hypothetical protein